MKTSTVSQARRIGSREAYMAVAIALTIDVIILLFNVTDLLRSGFLWTFLLFALGMLTFGQILGRAAATRIAQGWSPALVGTGCSIGTLALASFPPALAKSVSASYVPNFTEAVGIVLIILVYSCIPVILHGIWFGYRISRRVSKLAQP